MATEIRCAHGTDYIFIEANAPTERNLTCQKVAILGIALGAGLLTINWAIGLGLLALSTYAFHFIQTIDDPINEVENLLIATAERGNRITAQFLLFLGANPNFHCDHTTPLRQAASFGNLDIAKDLIEAGADVNVTDGCSRTALYWAVYYHRLDMVQLLLDQDAAPGIRAWGPRYPDDTEDALETAVRCLNEYNSVYGEARSHEEKHQNAIEIEKRLRDLALESDHDLSDPSEPDSP